MCLIQSLTYLISLQALLSGCSAGGLASLIHCDDFPKFLPKDATVKCLSDAGFFLDEYVFLFLFPLICYLRSCMLSILESFNIMFSG